MLKVNLASSGGLPSTPDMLILLGIAILIIASVKLTEYIRGRMKNHKNIHENESEGI